MRQQNNRGFAGPGVGGKGNGHFPLNDPRALEGLFNQQIMPNVLKEFVHPGKDPREMLMRTILRDERVANAAVLYFAKCIEFDLPEEKEVFLNWLASRPSIGGIARRELLMGSTNIIAPTLYPGMHQWGNRRGHNKDGQEEQ